MAKYFFTSESVTEGHPDKICDQISDAVVDEALRQDPESRVAIETGAKNGGVMVFGEMTTRGYVDVPRIAREVLKDIGYTKSEYGIEWETCSVWTQITEQSPDIAQGIDVAEKKEQGAGDQGMMFGFACRETEELMPLPITLAHRLTMRLAEARKSGEITYLRPDGKSQVTVEYEDGKPKRIDAVVVSTQHDDGIAYEVIKKDVTEKIIRPVCGYMMDAETKIFINPTGSFVRGGPYADAGVTGRKIIVDTYGGMGRHGGGAFSGKDTAKGDRSGAYVARYMAKNIVAAGLADKCEVQIAYAIGVAKPVSILVECFGTERVMKEKIEELAMKHFPVKPADIILHFKLRRPIYRKTAAYGHFGRDFPWEKTDKAELLRREAGI